MKKFYIILQIVILIFLKILIILKTELTEDEAYYFLWSSNLDLSYFDHPPMVAYLIKISKFFLGDKEQAVRFPAFFLGLIFLLVLVLIFKEIDKSKILTSIYVFSLILIFSVGGVIITPDTPMALFILFTFYFLLKSERKPFFLYLAAFSYGLSLLSKYVSILILPSIIIFFFQKKKLFSKEFPLFLLISFLIFSPCIIWNLRNDFISFKFQIHHGYGKKEIEFINLLLYLVDSVLILSFPLSILIYFYGFKGIFKEGINFLTLSFLFPFLFFMISSLKTKAEANWPVISYIFLLIIAIKYLKENKIFYINSFITFLLIFYIHFHTLYPLIKFKKDPTLRMKGWKELAYDVEWFAERYNIKNFAANNYQISSLLSFYLKDRPFVYSLNINSRENQFTIWQKDKKIPDTLLYVGEINAGFKKFFKEIKKIGESENRIRKIEIYLLIK